MTRQHPQLGLSTMVQLLAHRAEHAGGEPAYLFLRDGEDDVVTWTWADLDRRARVVAAWLQQRFERGDRVMLMYPEGLEYLAGLFGCMYAGMLAVPTHPPDPRRLHRTLPRVRSMAEDAAIVAVLTESVIVAGAKPHIGDVPALARAEWCATETLPDGLADAYAPVEIESDDLAYLQYTSGSTSTPKGVMVSHHNLIHQLDDFDTGYDHEGGTLVTWLPATHDLGLVYGRFMPLFKGIRCVFLSPGAFMQRPFRWVRALSEYGGTHTCAPNFGYEVVARKVTDDELAALDLSSLRVALNGAEPIREASERAFVERFAQAGMPPAAMTHAMGMSEATAKIMTEPIDRDPPRFVWVDADALRDNRAVVVAADAPGALQIASNGVTSGDTRVVPVDPETREILHEGRVGEMWVSGQTVAQGYWNNPVATEAGFRAQSADGQGPFLRTGDLIFRLDGEIYICGRLKDVVILRGQNHHPQDLEWSVGSAHPALRPNCAAAFSVPGVDGEQLVVVTEVYPDRVGDPETVFGAIREALGEHGVQAAHLVLLAPRALPKTSSGKIQRAKSRHLFLADDLDALHRWDRKETERVEVAGLRGQLIALSAPDRPARIVHHLQQVTAGLLGLDADDIDDDRPLKELGLDSVTAVEMVEAVGAALQLTLSGTVLFDYPTLEQLGDYLASELEEAAAPTPEAAETTSSEAPDVAGMSEAEAEAALLAELEDLL